MDDIRTQTQFSIFLVNKPGVLAQVTHSLAEEKINVIAMTLVDSQDGFAIAEMDLKLRGPGEFFGTKQSGLPTLRIANILRDPDILAEARHEARAFVERPPSHLRLKCRGRERIGFWWSMIHR